MKRKEIATALGLSVALAVTGCGTTNEPVEIVQVEESTPTEVEEPTEPVEVIEAETESVDESLITISEDEEPLHDTEVTEQVVNNNSDNKYIGMTTDELYKLIEDPGFSKLPLEEQAKIIDAIQYAPDFNNNDLYGTKVMTDAEIAAMSDSDIELLCNSERYFDYTESTCKKIDARLDEIRAKQNAELTKKYGWDKPSTGGGGQTGPVDCETPPCDAYDASICQADGWISY